MATARILSGPEAAPWRLDRVPPRPLSPNGRDFRTVACRELRGLISSFDPIGLAEMKEVALLDRFDTKYVMSVHRLYSALAALAEHYRVLEIDGTRVNRYRKVYFDTENLAMYREHHSDSRIRYKVRSREYVDTNQSFVEVKWKGKRGRTVKERVQTDRLMTEWEPAMAAAIAARIPFEASSLLPSISNEFLRVTLVSRCCRERVTLDTGLRFHGDGRSLAIPGIAIAEVKQDGVDRSSPFVRQMRAAGIRPRGFSKYCTGVSMLRQEVKHNRFKPRLRLIGTLMGDSDDIE